jgi:hypothetical protein
VQHTPTTLADLGPKDWQRLSRPFSIPGIDYDHQVVKVRFNYEKE